MSVELNVGLSVELNVELKQGITPGITQGITKEFAQGVTQGLPRTVPTLALSAVETRIRDAPAGKMGGEDKDSFNSELRQQRMSYVGYVIRVPAEPHRGGRI